MYDAQRLTYSQTFSKEIVCISLPFGKRTTTCPSIDCVPPADGKFSRCPTTTNEHLLLLLFVFTLRAEGVEAILQYN